MSRNSIILLSTAMLLATTVTGAFAGGSSGRVGGNSASSTGVASNPNHPQAVRGEAHRSTLAAKLPTTLVGVAQKSPSSPKAHDDSDQLPILDHNGKPVAVQGDPNQNGSHEPSVSSGGTVWFEDGTGGYNKDGDFGSGASDGTAAAVKGPSNPSATINTPPSNLLHAGGAARSTIAQ